MQNMLVRRRLATLGCWVVASVAQAQGPASLPKYDPLAAPGHVGDTAVVCGEVIDLQCWAPESGDDVTMTLVPSRHSAPFRVRIPASNRAGFGTRLDRYDGHQVCATGKIDAHVAGYEIVAMAPEALALADEGKAATPLLAPDAHHACDAGVVRPKVVREVKPHYTHDAEVKRLAGTVLVLVVVRSDGTVGDTRVRRSLDPGLDGEAVKAVRRWRFTPGMVDGKPTPVVVAIEMAFQLAG